MALVKTKKASQTKKTVTRAKRNKGFEKAWMFWKTVRLDLSQFKFSREDANAR